MFGQSDATQPGSILDFACVEPVDAACIAACDCLAASFDVIATRLPTPPGDSEGRQLLLRVGARACVHVAVVNGSFQARSLRTCDVHVGDMCDITVRLDGVHTLLRLVDSEGSLPGLMLRRKIRLEGDVSLLQKLRSNATASGSNHATSASLTEARRVLSAQLKAAVEESRVKSAASFVTSSDSFGALWVPDGASDACMTCNSKFTLVRRRHHCRGCGQLLCAFCAPRVRDRASTTCVPRRGSANASRRLCASCRANGNHLVPQHSTSSVSTVNESYNRSILSNGAAAPSSPMPRLLGNTDTKAQMSLADMKAELELARKNQLQAGADLLQGIASATTQLFAIAFGVTLMMCFGFASVLLYSLCVSLLYLFPHVSIRRYSTIFWTAIVVWAKLRQTKAMCRKAALDDDEVNALWLSTHGVLARFIFDKMSALGGFWNKIGQALSVNVMLPDPYIQEFGKFQDQLPPSPMDEVLATLREDFGDEIVSRLQLDPKQAPLGVASVGQVHRARWHPLGASEPIEVVLKVQHRGIRRRFMQDMNSALVLSKIIAMIDTESVPDFRPMASKMREVTQKELDFRLEAANQTRAWQAVQDNSVDVLIPKVTPELVSRRALAMEFIDGVSFRNLEKELPEVDRERIMASLADHFAVQFAVDGHFHADPHPGNLLVERNTGRLCVLDWGMCCTLPATGARNYAAIFHAIATRNVWAVSDIVTSLGIKQHRANEEEFKPFRLMNVFRFALRDTQPLSVARSGMRELGQTRADMRRTGKIGKPQMKEIDGDLLYMFRAIDLVSNSAAQLGVTHSILTAFFRRSLAVLVGRPALLAQVPCSPHDFLPPFQIDFRHASNALEEELLAILKEFYANGLILGVQLCVQDASNTRLNPVLLDIAAGVQGWTNSQPVTAETVFNWLDISKLPMALALLRLVDTCQLRLNDCVSKHWPEFCGGTDVTVEHVLGHTAGLYRPLPPKIAILPDVLDFETTLKAYAGARSLEAPGESQRYHYGAFGYLCAGLCRHAAREELESLWDDTLKASGLYPSDLLMRIPGKGEIGNSLAVVERAASSTDMQEISSFMLRVQQQLASDNDNASPHGGVRSVTQELFGREHLLDLSFYGNHSLSHEVSAACLPGMQAFGTARTAATLVRSVSLGHVFSAKLLVEALRSRKPVLESDGANSVTVEDDELSMQLGHVLQIESMTEWGLGLQLLSSEFWSSGNTAKVKRTKNERNAWGHLAQTGSAALYIPGQRPVTVGLMLNLATHQEDSSAPHPVTRAVLAAIDKYYQNNRR